MSNSKEWHEHLRPNMDKIRELANGPEPHRAADWADGTLAGLEYILGEADVEVPEK